jgi:hypothetical protein
LEGLPVATFYSYFTSLQANADAEIEDLNHPGFDIDAEPIRYFYTDAYEYEQIFKPLIDLESENDRRMKEGCAHHGVRVKWDWGLNHKRQAHFQLPKLMDGGDLMWQQICTFTKLFRRASVVWRRAASSRSRRYRRRMARRRPSY